mgnify:CR=1 FL=1
MNLTYLRSFLDNIELFYEKVLASIEAANEALTQKAPEEALKVRDCLGVWEFKDNLFQFSDYEMPHHVLLKKLKDITSNREVN